MGRKNIVTKKYNNTYMINSRKLKFSNFNHIINTIGRLYFVKDYCALHGDLILHPTLFKKYYDNNEIFCSVCRDTFIEKFNPLDHNMNKIKDDFEILYKRSSSSIDEKYLKQNHILIYSSILYFTKNMECSRREKTFLYRNGLSEIPKCPECGNTCQFSVSNMRYNLYCEKHNVNHYKSIDETKVYDFIKENYNGEIIRNYRFDRSEFDIYIPDLKLTIEYNGLYWHSSENKNKKYHYDKWKKCEDRDIQLITIWEDDWKWKNDIIKSIILNKIGLLNNKIDARKCTIRSIGFSEAKEFLNENHIQGQCISPIRLGLFFNDDLVSIMTFSKKRMVLGDNKDNRDSNTYEMTRFCSKKYYVIRGAASKLFKYFINNFEIEKIISYANMDISNGNLYKKLKFNYISYNINYWWAIRNKKYHRSNFMKHTINGDKNKSEKELMLEKGYYKIYGVGNLKFEYINKEL